ncbi:inositol monophosphatase [Natrarchaeobius halalkaliphilus]|uniref:Inositol monophosphatase n=1 Tax=Natrarchaeobius halalkaliphilus TaxID=1679091 RepID=A0A3N6LK35_9EURY|nr:inositol monophosphatase family protein [Natrarchaeobius halalkaliphilus]RQG86728.1 inositol monophosphatase [Natrarchaeobius halalkaliphilus]
MDDLPENEYLKTAITAAKSVGDLQNEHCGNIAKSEFKYKSRRDLVTETDIQSEKEIIDIIATKYPNHTIAGEETKGVQGESDKRWVIDPIDGTTNYYHGVPFYAVSIAFKKDGEAEIGVVYCPSTDETYCAINGNGAYYNNKRITVSGETDWERSLIGTGFLSKHIVDEELLGVLQVVVNTTHGIRRFGSAAASLAMVASGQIEGYYHPYLNTWDIAAGVLMVKEAGGTIETFETDEGDSLHVVATNGNIQTELSRLFTSSVTHH